MGKRLTLDDVAQEMYALGVGSQFEVIGLERGKRKGGNYQKVVFKCLACGCEFTRYLCTLRKTRASNLHCDRCDIKSDGSFYSVANKGVHDEERFLKQFNTWSVSERFDYMGGYSGSHDLVTLRCKCCGRIIERTVQNIRQYNTVCECHLSDEQCEKDLLHEYGVTFWDYSKYEDENDYWYSRYNVCKACGKEFHSVSPTALYCSRACKRRKHSNARAKHRRWRKRITNWSNYDQTITLEKLYECDGGVCYICGELTDWNDIHYSEKGHKFIGLTYPTVDHVVPLANGGTHSWDNVKLAHHYCNGVKRDITVEEARDQLT